LLQSSDIQLPDISTRMFTTHSKFSSTSFTLPVLQLALAQFPRIYLPEIIGYTVGHYINGTDYWLHALKDELTSRGLNNQYCKTITVDTRSTDVGLGYTLEAVRLYLEQFLDESERQEHWQRIWRGAVAHTVIGQDYIDSVTDIIQAPVIKSPRQKMLEMVIDKAPHARNMHGKKRFGKRHIDDWFNDEPFDAEGFLDALEASPYVNQKSPEKSQLISRSIEFGGPMFRIFTEAEVAIMEEWVHSLSDGSHVLSEEQMKPVSFNAPSAIVILM